MESFGRATCLTIPVDNTPTPPCRGLPDIFRALPRNPRSKRTATSTMSLTYTFPTYNLEKSVLEGWLSETFNDYITADVCSTHANASPVPLDSFCSASRPQRRARAPPKLTY